MNRRQLFRNVLGLAGAAVVAPKLLADALPVAAEPINAYVEYGVVATNNMPSVQWSHKTPDDILVDMAFIYGICRAPGEDDASLKRRMKLFMQA